MNKNGKMVVFVKIKIRNVVRFVKFDEEDLEIGNLNRFFEKIFSKHVIDENANNSIDFELFDNTMAPIEHENLLPIGS